MSVPYGQYFSTLVTPQFQPIPGSSQVPNNAGGYAYAIDDWERLDRFLILGSEGGCYYIGERGLTLQNAQAVRRCLALDGRRVVDRIVAISEAGRAPKNDPAVFALAMAAGMGAPKTRLAALTALPQVCRIGTHLFQFVENVRAFRGWGRALKRAVRDWYTAREARTLAYQLVKYQQRNGWSHRDLIRLGHPRAESGSALATALAWAMGKLDPAEAPVEGDLALLGAFEAAKRATTAAEIVRLIRHNDLVRECIPTRWLSEPTVWEALLEKMPLTALVRNLATLTRLGLLTSNSEGTRRVLETLGNKALIRKARVHPVALLIAQRTYSTGRGVRNHRAWNPVARIVEALDRAFYLAFGNVEPTGKRWLLGLDVSGSMSAQIAGMPLSCSEAATAMALVTAHVEKHCTICGFADRLRPMPISARSRLDQALACTRSMTFGATDCAQPMLYALERGLSVDAFVVLTDNETWAGGIHPVQALQRYRRRMGIPAKLIVLGMTSAGFSIADPMDPGMMDVVGFDSAVPQLMSEFVRGAG